MGSVFRKITTRPVPSNATIIRREDKTLAEWVARTGKKKRLEVVTLNDGRQAIRQESSTYFAKYRDREGIVRVVSTGCRDETSARQVLATLEKDAERVRSGVVTTDELSVADRMTAPLGQHIADYVATLTGSASHRENTNRYLLRLAKDCKWTRLSELRRDDLELWLARQTKPKEQGGRSARSRNAFHTAAVSFAGWCVTSKRLTVNPFSRMAKAKVKLDRRRVRRSLSADEVERLIEATSRAPGRPPTKPGAKTERPAERLPATVRALLWRFMFGTGIRVNEARQLRIRNLVLNGPQPGVNLPAKITKTKAEDQYVPLSPSLASLLAHHTAGKKPGDPLFPIPSDILRRFYSDCKRAGITLVDEDGKVVDVHALRTSFVDGLVKAGVAPRIVQELARHADMATTMEHYTDIRLHDLHGAIASVAPSVAPTPDNSGATMTTPDKGEPFEKSPEVRK